MTLPAFPELNTEQMAELLDMSPQRLRELTRRGDVPKAGHGRYDPAQAVPAYCRTIRAAAAGRGGGEGQPGALDLVQERAALAKAQREKLEREAAQAACELVPAEEVKKAWFRVTRVARDRLLALPAQLAPLLARSDSRRAHDLLTAEMRRTLEHIAQEPTTGTPTPTDEHAA